MSNSNVYPTFSLDDFAELQQSLMDLITKEYLDHLCNLFKYDGFDPKALRSAIQMLENDRTLLMRDLCQLITVLLHAENCTFISKSKKEILERARLKYNIQTKLLPSSPGSTITFHRILKSYPDFALLIMSKNRSDKIKRPVPLCQIISKGYINFPNLLRGSFVFGVINKNIHHGIVKAVLHHQILETRILNARKVNYTNKQDNELLDNVLKYALLAFRNSPINNKDEYVNLIKSKVPVETAKLWEKNFDEKFPSYKGIGCDFYSNDTN